jgi:hypothetical protein
MHPHSRFLQAQALACWNWKCAVTSATARSLVYLVAMARTGLRGSLAVVLVEIAYVALTAGIYAGMQQKALGLRSRLLGNLTIVFGVPGLSQALDWFAHHMMGAPVPARATAAVCFYATLSALFHLHVMRSGAFLTGQGQSLLNDFRRMPRLIATFVTKPVAFVSAWLARDGAATGSEPAL